MNSNPWQVDSIQTFYCLKCPECMFFSHEEFNFKHHAMENHPLSYLLFGKSENNEEMAQHEENYGNLPSTSINSNSLIDPAMIKKESSEAEIKDNSDLKLIEMNGEYFVPTTNIKDENAMVENENSEYLESSGTIKEEENSETVFAESIDLKEEYSDGSDAQNDPIDTFTQPESDGIRMKSDSKSEILQGQKPYKCPKCDMCFYYPGIGMKNHIRLVHEGEKRFQCSICSKSFKTKESLRSHTLHQHLCSICDANFSQKSKLEKHKDSVHTAENINHKGKVSFQCKICNGIFRSKHNLHLHIDEVHEGQKPLKCERCGSSFTQKSSLDGHIKLVHEGIKTFLCDICNKAFGTNSAMKKHVSQVHEGKKNMVFV